MNLNNTPILNLKPVENNQIPQEDDNEIIEVVEEEPIISHNINRGTTTFYELINVDKLRYIINHYRQFKSIIKEQEKDMRRKDKNYNAYTIFQKILNNICNTF